VLSLFRALIGVIATGARWCGRDRARPYPTAGWAGGLAFGGAVVV